MMPPNQNSKYTTGLSHGKLSHALWSDAVHVEETSHIKLFSDEKWGHLRWGKISDTNTLLELKITLHQFLEVFQWQIFMVLIWIWKLGETDQVKTADK